MAIQVQFSGGKEMAAALAGLRKATAKAVVRRAMIEALEPVRATAESYSVFDVGVGDVLTPSQASQVDPDLRSTVTMFVGPYDDEGKGAPHAHLIEFGTGPRFHASGKYVGFVSPDPFLRPAWDMHREAVLEKLGALIWAEIEKSEARIAARGA